MPNVLRTNNFKELFQQHMGPSMTAFFNLTSPMSPSSMTSQESRISVYRRQILTTEVHPRTVRIKIFIMSVDP